LNMFISTADELFGLITTIRHPSHSVKHVPWTVFTFGSYDWEHINNTCIVISDANDMQQIFSSEQHPTLWCAIPALEQLQTTWEKKWDMLRYVLYQGAIQKGLNKIGKYYRKFINKPVYVLALVLHPYYKLNYITMAWGGQEEQARELAAGNQNTKNWHGKALQVVEKTMQAY
ncbi:uncharacterized protein EDB91DRAFT_1003789, partial [Suillus paluster]|uniref:uncharacterized protein n=1 Tax=Suillus paluster TaxID=48578 RepID=UPI001B87BC9C